MLLLPVLLSSFLLALSPGSALPLEAQKQGLFSRELQLLNAQLQVAQINTVQQKWTAELNPRFAEMAEGEYKRFLGVPLNGSAHFGLSNGVKATSWMDLKGWNAAKATKSMGLGGQMPKEFDARKQWPECADVIGKIQDQSSCGSCWAVSSASVIQDRICIASGGKQKVDISAHDILSCAFPVIGCSGGLPQLAFEYWTRQGVCTGSAYPHPESKLTAQNGCKPYPFPPKSQANNMPTPRCEQSCENPEYGVRYTQDRHYGFKPVLLQKAHEDDIKRAILEGGPVTASFVTYKDLFHYKKGVYEHVDQTEEGGHAVRVIGWGEEEGTPFWLIANSWNSDWGEQGLLKMVRGKDEGHIESWGISFAQAELK